MTTIESQTFDEERALYGSHGLTLRNCRFDGPADGESPLKECTDVVVDGALMSLRYPLWHGYGIELRHVEMTDRCRAALWYSSDVSIQGCALHGTKAVRECSSVHVTGCDVDSPEFGWSTEGLLMRDTTVSSRYFLMRSRRMRLHDVRLTGRYSFQYVENAILEHCELDTKDAFWHARHVVVRDSLVKGDYLAWYSEDVTFDNCTIVGTQPLCYCRDLRLINCRMVDCDLSFERSVVRADLTGPIESIKDPMEGSLVTVPAVGEVIRDVEGATGVVRVTEGDVA